MEQAVWLFTGGEGPADATLLSDLPKAVQVYAADSGLDLARSLGYIVDLAVGDFDSIADTTLLTTIRYEQHCRDKDETDTELLLKIMKAHSLPYVLIGGGGRRFDHLLHLYSLFSTYGAPRIWITARETLYLVESTAVFKLEHETPCSILPAYSDGTSYVNSRNLEWELNDYAIHMKSMSISNRVKTSPISLNVKGCPVFFSIIRNP